MSYSSSDMRKSRLTFVQWEDDKHAGCADEFQSCKKFRAAVYDYGITRQMDMIEHEIEKLENLMRLCAYTKDLKDLMRLLP